MPTMRSGLEVLSELQSYVLGRGPGARAASGATATSTILSDADSTNKRQWRPRLRRLVDTVSSFVETQDGSNAQNDESVDWNTVSVMQAHPESPVAPLCEDVEDETLEAGDRCWSTCQGQCPQNVLKPGLVFDFDEVRPGHPGCVSHFECVGNYDRVLCHALDGVQAASFLPPVASENGSSLLSGIAVLQSHLLERKKKHNRRKIALFHSEEWKEADYNHDASRPQRHKGKAICHLSRRSDEELFF
ncbi:unnamed protein product [Amoebophrya sp. A25]|nr:unnamed protein product [Amoebophrya sp. A25]|eukprot:GSA25T00026746001.1